MSADKLYSEVFEDFDKCVNKEERINLLRKYGDKAFVTFLQFVFDPNIKFSCKNIQIRSLFATVGFDMKKKAININTTKDQLVVIDICKTQNRTIEFSYRN